ncbi:DUF6750 family protein [Psychromonas sp. SP041]|uniref:DUF6750 family protein n=1 Tax=Psychromonas sp. SP041 TaxID=1365007 RepID=UPI0010C7ABFA|nr:DUF6750 family protein [Psychromonas sp. SP041]
MFLKIKKMLSNKSVILSLMTILAMSVSLDVAAEDGWAEALETGTETLDAIKAFVVAIAYTGGVILFVIGLFLIYKDNKEEGRGHFKNGIYALIIGSILLILPTAIGWSVVSVGAKSSDMETEVSEDF